MRSLRLHWPLAAVGVGRGYDRGEPPRAAVAAARRAGSPWPEQMDRKMLRFVEKTRNSHRQNAPSADRSVVRPPAASCYYQRKRSGEESKPVAHPCRGPGGQAGDHQQRQGHPLSGARETWLAPNVIGAWGVTTLSANLAGDDSWVAGIELATASEPPARRPRIWGRCPSGVDPSHP